MTALSAFFGLLTLAYLGAVAFRRGGTTRLGLPSGTEFLVLGYFLGPALLGVADSSLIDTFEPLIDVGLSWLGLAGGIRFGTKGEESASPKLISMSLLLAVATASLIFGVAYGALHFFGLFSGHRVQFAIALAIVGAETSPFAVRWALSRNRSDGGIEELMTTVAHSDELVSMGLLAYLATTLPSPRGVPIGHSLPWTFGTLFVGLVLGALGSLLFRNSLGKAEAMSFLFGATVLGTGFAVELGLGFPALAFALGLGLRLLSPHRHVLQKLAVRGEEAMLFPILLLAGLKLEIRVGWLVGAVLGLALLARLVGKYLSGLALGRNASNGSVRLGLALGSSGALAIALAFTIALIDGGPLGNAVLVFAALTTVIGDLTSPLSIKKSIEETAPPPLVREVSA